MIEALENGFQLCATGFCALLSLHRARTLEKREWALLSMFAGAFFFGDLYWLLYIIVYEKTPFYSFIPDLSWVTSYLFLLILLIHVRRNDPLRNPRYPRALWLVLVPTVGMCLLFMQSGDYISNLVYAFFMSGLLWHAISGLLDMRKRPERDTCGRRNLYLLSLLFCVDEYLLWTASWLFPTAGDTLLNPYYWFDAALSVIFLLYLPVLRKVAGNELH